MSSCLIKNGNVLLTKGREISFAKVDILVEGNRISRIESEIELDKPHIVQLVDASGSIVTPGFVDAHRHVFQSQLRSTVSNHTLLEYCAHLLQGRMIFLDEDDMYLSQLSGLIEAVNCGVTTIMDHSHAVTTVGRARQCIKATIESGIRSIYCAAPFAIPESLNPLILPDMTVLHAEQISMIKELGEESPLGGHDNDGRVRLGLGFDTMHHVSQEICRDVLNYAVRKDLNVTMHDVPRYNLPSLDFLRHNNMPLPKVTLSHTCDPEPGDIGWIKEKQVGIVCTPESEMAMSHGHPSAFDFYRAGCRIGLGVDSPAICSGDPFFTMRLALQERRVRENAAYHARGKLPDVVPARTDEILYMATQGGAAAIHMENEIGSLEVGKLADIVLIRTDSPSMIASVDYSAALVTHYMVSDVHAVMINGEWVKRDGELKRINWNTLKEELRQNRASLENRWQGVNWESNKSDLKTLWGLGSVLE